MIKLLVVDDENGVCDVIRRTFSYIGFSVFTATNAERALLLFRKERPKIVFLDLVMPGTDGIGLLRQFKEIDAGVIVIVVTAVGGGEARAGALAAGAEEYIQKPFSHNYLRDVVLEKIKAFLDKQGGMLPPKILLVDDEKELRQSMRAFIEPRFGCEILEAEGGEVALETVRSMLPDVVFLDIKMPGVSGLDIIEQVRSLVPEAKIVIVSAWNSGEVMSRALDLGADDYMSKPLSMVILGEKLKTMLLSMGKLVVKKV